MRLRLFVRSAAASLMACTLAMGVCAAQPVPAASKQLSAEQIRALKIEFLEDCCYNAGGANEESIASLPIDLVLRYPAQRAAAEAQVPRLNHMFAGRYLGYVLALDPPQPRILYFVKNLSAADIARVKTDPQLPNVQLAPSAYTLGEAEALAQRLRKEGLMREAGHPQGKAALMSTYDVRYPSLQSINAFPEAVLLQHGLKQHASVQNAQFWPTLQALFGHQLLSGRWDDRLLGAPHFRGYVHQPKPEQLQHLQRDPDLREVEVVSYPYSSAQIQRVEGLIQDTLALHLSTPGDFLLTMLSFDYEQRKYDVSIMPGRLEEARQRLSRRPEIPADCCILREQPPPRTLEETRHEDEIRRQPASRLRQQLSN
ncbi:MAG: hypothetical protein QM772_17225 [Ottowia sp.]|uniref:hypothetical protein n=1 Tax=Ottowia sp. TaxID=1898956 RepID=UPI0039E2D4E8